MTKYIISLFVFVVTLLFTVSGIVYAVVDNNVSKPEEGKQITLNILVENPPDAARLIAVKEYLPKEIKAEDVIEVEDGLLLGYDLALDSYYISGEVQLRAGERRILKVKVDDIFIISADKLISLKQQVETLMLSLEGTSYFAQATILKSEIDVDLESILRTQAENLKNIERKISNFRNSQNTLKKVQENIKALKVLASEVSGMYGLSGRLSGVSTTTTWAIIIIVVIGIAILMILLYVLLMRSRALEHHISDGRGLTAPPIINVKKQARRIRGGLITYLLPPFGKPFVDFKLLNLDSVDINKEPTQDVVHKVEQDTNHAETEDLELNKYR